MFDFCLVCNLHQGSKKTAATLKGNFLILQYFAIFCKILQDSARFCKIVQDSARFCKILQDSARFCKILQFPKYICNHNLEIYHFDLNCTNNLEFKHCEVFSLSLFATSHTSICFLPIAIVTQSVFHCCNFGSLIVERNS